MNLTTILIATVVAAISGAFGIACIVWPFRVTIWLRQMHLRKPRWLQAWPLAAMVMRPWMPTYLRVAGVIYCLVALLISVAIARRLSN